MHDCDIYRKVPSHSQAQLDICWTQPSRVICGGRGYIRQDILGRGDWDFTRDRDLGRLGDMCKCFSHTVVSAQHIVFLAAHCMVSHWIRWLIAEWAGHC